MHLHSVFEHQSFRKFDPQPLHCRLLARANAAANNELLREVRIDSQTRFRATQHVGVLRLGNVTLQVLPKIYQPQTATEDLRQQQATRSLLTMLAYACDLPLIHHAAPLIHSRHDWFELLTFLFATNLRRQIHAAPHRAYQSFDDDLPLLRGKLRIADQLRRPDRQHRLACTFDEFSLDNALNRVFRFVVERLFHLTSSSNNRQLLADLRVSLDEVAILPHLTANQANPSILMTRLNQRYKPMLEFARLFLLDSTPQLSPGQNETVNFLFDMNDLFEKFVVAFIQKHRAQILDNSPLADTGLAYQSRGHTYHLATDTDRKQHFKLIPDLLCSNRNVTPLSQ